MRKTSTLLLSTAGALFAIGLLTDRALGHRPIFTETPATSAQSAIDVAQPDISQVVYRPITADAPHVWLTLEAEAGFELFIQIGVPVIDRLKDFRPAMAVLGPGLPEGAVPFEVPEGLGGRVFTTDNVSEPQFFHEPFTGTDSWILRSETVSLPEAGRYYVVAYVPSGETGKLWLSVGKREVFGLADLPDFVSWTSKVRDFHELPPTGGLFGLPCLFGIALLALPFGLFVKGICARRSSFMRQDPADPGSLTD